MFECLNKHLLRKIHRVVAIFNESITDTVDLPLIPDHDLVKGGGVSGEVPLDQRGVCVLITGGHWHRRC